LRLRFPVSKEAHLARGSHRSVILTFIIGKEDNRIMRGPGTLNPVRWVVGSRLAQGRGQPEL